MTPPPLPRWSLARRLAVLVIAAAAGLSACQDRPELRYETEHLRIGTSFEAPLCEGDLRHMESVVTSVETLLSTQLTGQIDVYLWPVEDWPADPSTCDTDVDTGCFTGQEIFTSIPALDHELVHAVVRTLGRPKPFWSEGAANALATSRTHFGVTSPVENLELEASELSYTTAGHFSRFVLDSFGAAKYRALLGAEGSARAAFEDTYQMTVEEAQQLYLANAPYSYAPLVSCEHAELAPVDDTRWSEVIDVDCDDSGTYGGPYGIGAYRTVSISTHGDYAISTTAAVAIIARCPDSNLDVMPVDGDPALGDVPPTTEAMPAKFVRMLSGGGAVNVLELAPGRYEIEVSFPDHAAHEVSLDVSPAAGP